jgi:hypothetical protein
VKRARRILLVSLLCSCTGPTGAGEGGKTAESVRVRFLDRSNPLVEYTFEIMEMRADRSQMRERFRAEGKRVCEEGETGTSWKEDCNDCRCDWGIRHCLNRPCKSPESVAKVRAEIQEYNRRQAERYRKLREMHRARGVRVCEEGEDGTSWKEGCNTCWCESGLRSCTANCARPPGGLGPLLRPTKRPDPEEEKFTVEPPPYTLEPSRSRSKCKEEEIGTYWQWGCNTCWCADGFRVCSKADCPSSDHPKGAAATDDTE